MVSRAARNFPLGFSFFLYNFWQNSKGEVYYTLFLNHCVQNTHVDERQHEICKSPRDTVYTSSALKTVHVVLEVCRQEGGLDPAARFPSRAVAVPPRLRDGSRLPSRPSSLPVSLTPGRPGAVPLAWRPGSLCALPLPLLPSSSPVPLPSSSPALLPSRRETRVCWQHACLPCPFGSSLTVLDLSQRFSSLISLLMALHLTESFPPAPHPFIFKSELILGP